MQVTPKNFTSIRKIVRLVSFACIALVIYGCSSIEEDIKNKEQVMTPEQQQLFILDKIESWSAAEPDVQRVLALEADMQLIVEQLASMAALDDEPLEKDKKIESIQSSVETTVSADLSSIKADSSNEEEVKSTDLTDNQQPEYSIAKVNNNKRSSRTLGHNFSKVGLHIAMFKDVNTIPLGWKYLQSILPLGLVNKKPLLAKINYQGSEYYSLRVGPFKSANSAKNICINIQRQQHYCSVVEYKGFSF